ncbi:MAG: hypothetical protein AAF958_05305 [Planctomycetota bacterium]
MKWSWRMKGLVAAWIVFGIALRFQVSPPWVDTNRSAPNHAAPLDDANIRRLRKIVREVVTSNDFDPTQKLGNADDARRGQLEAWGVRRMIFESYDPQARWVVGVGPDGKPGQANIDDGANGVVDDPGEIGASNSDDTFEILPSEDNDGVLSPTLDPSRYRVLSRGGFVEHRQSDAAAGAKKIPERVTVLGETFEMLIEIKRPLRREPR